MCRNEAENGESAAARGMSTGDTIRIVSYNVRFKDDGPGRTIDERAARLEAVMRRYDPDIMGFQEVVPRWLNHLEDSFGEDYDYINQWRAESSKESTPIFWKKSRFERADSGRFWLSDTPEQESKADSWGADCPRVCMWVKLRERATGKAFLFFNTHFDYKNETCHVNSAELVIQKATALGGFAEYAVFCTGDYNMYPDGKGYQAMCRKFADINRALDDCQEPTTDGYNDTPGDGIIDFCFYSPDQAIPLKYATLNEYVLGGYVSDHRGLYIEAGLK